MYIHYIYIIQYIEMEILMYVYTNSKEILFYFPFSVNIIKTQQCLEEFPLENTTYFIQLLQN